MTRREFRRCPRHAVDRTRSRRRRAGSRRNKRLRTVGTFASDRRPEVTR